MYVCKFVIYIHLQTHIVTQTHVAYIQTGLTTTLMRNCLQKTMFTICSVGGKDAWGAICNCALLEEETNDWTQS